VVNAVAEGDVAARVTVEVEAVGVGELGGIPERIWANGSGLTPLIWPGDLWVRVLLTLLTHEVGPRWPSTAASVRVVTWGGVWET
jgi:hypothetical protein